MDMTQLLVECICIAVMQAAIFRLLVRVADCLQMQKPCMAAGGDVMNVLFAALIGGFALGQAAPNLQYFQKGKASGAAVFSIIARQPVIADTPTASPPAGESLNAITMASWRPSFCTRQAILMILPLLWHSAVHDK